MESLPRPFTIEIGGKPISKLDGPLDGTDHTGLACKHAKTGSEPAVFELKECRLTSDGFVLARTLVEDRSLRPKNVYWFQDDGSPNNYRFVAQKNGDNYSLNMSGATLMAEDDTVFAALLQEMGGKVVVKMQD